MVSLWTPELKAKVARLWDKHSDSVIARILWDEDKISVSRNAVIGLRNAIAPPLTIHHDDDATGCWSEFTLNSAYEGPPGLVHGGVCALVLDHVLGEAASAGLTKPLFTGTLTVRFVRGTPLGRLRAEAAVERTEGVKSFVSGHLSDGDGITVEAEGIFIKPAWARGPE